MIQHMGINAMTALNSIGAEIQVLLFTKHKEDHKQITESTICFIINQTEFELTVDDNGYDLIQVTNDDDGFKSIIKSKTLNDILAYFA